MKINEKHFLLAHLLATGHTAQEAAPICGLSAARISQIRNEPDFVPLLQQCQAALSNRMLGDKTAELMQKLNEAAESAVDTLVELNTTAEMETVRLSAAKEILDRADIAPKVVRKTESDNVTKIVIESPTVHAALVAAKEINATEFSEFYGAIEGEYVESSPVPTSDPAPAALVAPRKPTVLPIDALLIEKYAHYRTEEAEN